MTQDPQVVSNIAEYGWHGFHVSDPDPDNPYFWSYSIGLLETWRHPELIIFGIQPEISHQLLWDAVREIEEGKLFCPLDRWEIFENGYEAVLLPVDAPWLEFLGQGLRHYGRDFPALQAAWPDRDRRMPWEAGYTSTAQPLLISGEVASRLGVTVDEATLLEALGPEPGET